jgi:MFS family permease
MNPRRLFVASCLALVTSAFSFQIRQDISDPLGTAFSLTKEQVGGVMGAAFLGMAIAMLVFAGLCDVLGMGRVLFLAWVCHLVGILGTIFAGDVAAQEFVQKAVASLPGNYPTSYWVLWIATFLVGSGNGLVEIAINPLAATLYPTEKTHYLNILHAWWPGGLIISGLLAQFAITPTLVGPHPLGYEIWQVKLALLLVPLALYGLLAIGQRFPQTERVAAKVSTGEMFLQALRPMFLLWAFCMMLTACTELGPNQWQESVLTRTAHVSGTLVFVYTSGLMFVMRFFAGPLAHALSPVGMLTTSAALAAGGLYWLSHADNPVMAFAASTVFGIGIAYFWPTMLGVTAERFPKGGALLLGLMGSVGNLAISQALPQMGAIYDSYTVNALISENPKLRTKMVRDAQGNEIPLVKEEEVRSWLPEAVRERIYPAGAKKLNPDAVTAVRNLAKEDGAEVRELNQDIKNAEKVGAAWAFRWVAVLPCVLIVVFGLIALIDKMRGGYKAVHIHDGPKPPGDGDGFGGPPGGPHAVQRTPGVHKH